MARAAQRFMSAADETQDRRALRTALEGSYLRRILIYLNDGDVDDRLLRTYLDSWFAYSRGGPMLDDRGWPQWLNRGDLEDMPDLCWHVHAISHDAETEVRAGRCSQLVKDHTIPKAYLVELMRGRAFADEGELRQFVRKFYTVSVLTQAQHRALNRVYRSKMPTWWTPELLDSDPAQRFARYGDPRVNITYRLLPAAHETWEFSERGGA